MMSIVFYWREIQILFLPRLAFNQSDGIKKINIILTQINKYYDKLRKNVMDTKQSIFDKIVQNNQFVKVKQESFVENAGDLEGKIKIIETKLK